MTTTRTTKPTTPTPIANDAAAMRDIYRVKLADARAEGDEIGIIVCGDCVDYWTRRAEFVDDGVSVAREGLAL